MSLKRAIAWAALLSACRAGPAPATSEPSGRGRICTGLAGEVQGVNCIPRAIADGDPRGCRREGEDIDGKDLGVRCCPGLRGIGSDQPIDGGCASSAPPSVLVCARCGDGRCGIGENRCNCSDDCSHP